MANGKVHVMAGCAAGLAVAYLDQPERKSDLAHSPAVAISVAGFFGKLPDILEPALHPHHRQFFHSVAVMAAMGSGMKKAYDWRPKDQWEALIRGLVLVAGGGYLSHLLFDAATPRSIPILGKA